MDNNPIIPKNRVYFKSAVFGANEKYTKDEIDQRIESSVMNQIDEEPILASVTLLFTANYKNPDKLNKCVEVLNKYIDNIMKSPNEEKFRKIKLENAVFKEKVYSCKYADLVLKKSGFKPTTIRTNDVEEDFFVYDNSDLTNLENLQSALSLGEPIIPELDRDLKIFKVTNTSKIADFELSDEFYNFTVEDLIKEQKLRNEAIEKSGMLRTKAMREKDEQLESRRYNYSLIRIRFPNDFFLQAVFKTSEKFDEIYKLVSECLETNSIPFDLIGHSLKKNATLSSTLGEIGLAPSAVLNFKWNIDGQITGNVIKKSLIESASYLK
jgi:UBX domain-containing protein 6